MHRPFPSTVFQRFEALATPSALACPEKDMWSAPKKIKRKDTQKARLRGDFLCTHRVLFAFIPLPELPLQYLTRGVFLSQLQGWPSHLRGGDDVPHHLAASRISEEGQDLLLVFSAPCLTAHLCPLDVLRAIPVRAKYEEVLSRLGPDY